MKIINERHKETAIDYSADYKWPDVAGWAGFSFPCDENGNVYTDFNNEAARKNYQSCIDGTYAVVFDGVRKNVHSWWEPAVGICDCGEEIQLVDDYMGATECDKCKQWFLLDGTPINPPEMWEEPLYEEDYY
jgi:hypothetical protein